jgi:hypothetical protein
VSFCLCSTTLAHRDSSGTLLCPFCDLPKMERSALDSLRRVIQSSDEMTRLANQIISAANEFCAEESHHAEDGVCVDCGRVPITAAFDET